MGVSGSVWSVLSGCFRLNVECVICVFQARCGVCYMGVSGSVWSVLSGCFRLGVECG